MKGGWTWLNETYARTQLFGTVGTATPGAAQSIAPGRSGWTLGGGLAYRFWSNWEVFGQYMYANYGTDNLEYSVFRRRSHTSLTVNTITGGVNLKF